MVLVPCCSRGAARIVGHHRSPADQVKIDGRQERVLRGARRRCGSDRFGARVKVDGVGSVRKRVRNIGERKHSKRAWRTACARVCSGGLKREGRGGDALDAVTQVSRSVCKQQAVFGRQASEHDWPIHHDAHSVEGWASVRQGFKTEAQWKVDDQSVPILPVTSGNCEICARQQGLTERLSVEHDCVAPDRPKWHSDGESERLARRGRRQNFQHGRVAQ
mmetsp:Transcript_25363/g.76389  ORF Transcript_25363/g.76389 Transcript_25363/m.76389 type:complete len:219 (-) Transcript_25363:235-891(-)